MFLLALSGIFGYGIVFERIPEVISELDARPHRQPHLVMVMIVLSSCSPAPSWKARC